MPIGRTHTKTPRPAVPTVKNDPKITLKKNARKRVRRAGQKKLVVVKDEKSNTKITFTPKQIAELKKDQKKLTTEKLVELLKPNPLYYSNSDFNVPVNGDALNGEEVMEACIFAHLASQPMFQIPLGVAALKCYLYWFMIDRLRAVGGLDLQPTLAQVPIFPDNGAMPTGWAKFVEYLMPFADRNGAKYQFRYNYTGFPATTSACLNVGASAGDFSYPALGNYALLQNPTPPTGQQEQTWMLINTPFSFINDITRGGVPGANGGYFDQISQWFSSSSGFTEAQYVPLIAPDASACAIPMSHASPNPGVYCQSDFYDNEMACIIHPPQNFAALTSANFFNLYTNDWNVKPLPQIFTSVPAKNIAGSNPNLNSQGQLELIISYGYLTHNCEYMHGGRKNLLKGAFHWPGLKSYCPYFYPMNLMNWHQAVQDVLGCVYYTPAAYSGGNNTAGQYADSSDVATVAAFFESVMIARTMSSAYAGILLYTNDDIVSQTNYGTEFLSANINPAMADMLDVLAPTVRNGRIVHFVYDLRPMTSYPPLALSGAIANTTCCRWAQIGTNFGITTANLSSNLNAFTPNNGIVNLGWTTQPWAFNFVNGQTITPQIPSNTTWVVRGAGTQGNAAGFNLTITEAALGITSPQPAIPVAGTTAFGPITPNNQAARFVNKVYELYGALVGTWLTFDWGRLGGYVNHTQLMVNIEPQTEVVGTAVGNGNGGVTVYAAVVVSRLSAYFALDRESVGRSMVYSPRITVFRNDRFPNVQTCAGNSAYITSLIDNTTQGPASAFNQELNANMSTGKLNRIQATRAYLGNIQRSYVSNFSSLVFTVPQAMMIIKTVKTNLTVSPYHDEQSATLTQFNSPSLWDDVWNTIWDIGRTVIDGGLQAVGGALSGKLIGLKVNPETHPVLAAAHPYIRQVALLHPPPYRPPAQTTLAIRNKMKARVDKANKYAAKLHVPPSIPVDEIDYDKIGTVMAEKFASMQFVKISNDSHLHRH